VIEWVVAGSVAVLGVGLCCRRRLPPARRRFADVDPAELAATMDRQLDTAKWREHARCDGVTVYSASDLDCPFVGFRTVTEHRGIEPEAIVAYLGPGLLDAFAEMNAQYVDGQELRPADARGVSVVRTAFAMPGPLADREFVHALFTRREGGDRWFVGYLSVDDDDLGPVADGFVRCPIYPSGQRITRLPSGVVRVEHLMVYDLAGGIAPWVQNTVFHRGHVGAYLTEWRTLGDRLHAARHPEVA
jgi:START domain